MESKITKAAGVSRNGQPVKTAVGLGLREVEDHSGMINAGIERSEAATGKMEVKQPG